MIKEIYDELKSRISLATEEQKEALYEDYPETDRDIPVYYFDVHDCEDEIGCPGFVHPMKTRNIWNVAQRFLAIISFFDGALQSMMQKRHTSCK